MSSSRRRHGRVAPAAQLAIKRSSYQGPPKTSAPHYDITDVLSATGLKAPSNAAEEIVAIFRWVKVPNGKKRRWPGLYPAWRAIRLGGGLAFRAARYARHSTHGLWCLPGRNPAETSGGGQDNPKCASFSIRRIRNRQVSVEVNRKGTKEWHCQISACASFEAGSLRPPDPPLEPEDGAYIYGARNNIR